MPDLGTILGVWGHPDDEAYLSAGLMAEAVDAGRRVVCVTATRGEAGFPGDDPRSESERRAVREAEMKASLDIIGVTEHRWLDYADGHCHEVPVDEPVAELCRIIEEVRPDTLLTFGPDGMTGHDDHIAVSRWTTAAYRKMRRPDMQLLYATKSKAWGDDFLALVDPGRVMMVEGMEPVSWPDDQMHIWFDLDEALLDRKTRALLAQGSQVEELATLAGPEGFSRFNREEFFRLPTEDEWPD